MSKYWLHYSQSAKWSHRSRTQPCTVAGFFKGSNIWPNPSLSPALAPAGALLSAVRISMCGSAPGSGFSELLLGAVKPLQRCAWIGSWNSSCSASSGRWTGWLPRWYGSIWVHMFLTPTFIHVIRLAAPASLKALCWLPLLTSETWPAPWRWALTSEQEPCNRISKTLLWNTSRCQIHDVAYRPLWLSVRNMRFLRAGMRTVMFDSYATEI